MTTEMTVKKITQKDKNIKRWTTKQKRTIEDQSKRPNSQLIEVSEREGKKGGKKLKKKKKKLYRTG